MAPVIAGVLTVLGDEDVVALSVRNLLDQGVDMVFAAVGDDAARRALVYFSARRVHLSWQKGPYHKQQAWTDQLARHAAACGAEWIIPFDADEFWYGVGGTLAEVVASVPPAVNVLHAELSHHNTWDDRVVPPESLPKVMYRWQPDAKIGPGNHTVDMPGVVAEPGRVQIRHLQYRSFEHFCDKVRIRNERLAPEGRARGDGVHHLRLEGANESELRAVYEALMARPTVHDPIPAA